MVCWWLGEWLRPQFMTRYLQKAATEALTVRRHRVHPVHAAAGPAVLSMRASPARARMDARSMVLWTVTKERSLLTQAAVSPETAMRIGFAATPLSHSSCGLTLTPAANQMLWLVYSWRSSGNELLKASRRGLDAMTLCEVSGRWKLEEKCPVTPSNQRRCSSSKSILMVTGGQISSW